MKFLRRVTSRSTLFGLSLLYWLVAFVTAASGDEPAPTLDRLQRAPLIRCIIREREVTFTDAAQLERVRAWIQQYAWPPIDIRTTGNVIPRGHFEVFDRTEAAKPAFTVHVFGVTTAAEPRVIHVTSENWQKFLSLVPSK